MEPADSNKQSQKVEVIKVARRPGDVAPRENETNVPTH